MSARSCDIPVKERQVGRRAIATRQRRMPSSPQVLPPCPYMAAHRRTVSIAVERRSVPDDRKATRAVTPRSWVSCLALSEGNSPDDEHGSGQGSTGGDDDDDDEPGDRAGLSIWAPLRGLGLCLHRGSRSAMVCVPKMNEECTYE